MGQPDPNGPGTTGGLHRVFASGVYGSDFHLWGAVAFSNEGTRDRLARTIGPDDLILTIGMMEDTPEEERGRLLALSRVSAVAVRTEDVVDPDHWHRSVERYGQRWRFGLAIRTVERLTDLPLRSEILPRIAEKNLFRQLGSHYVELTPAEAAAVLALPRTPDLNIYTTARSGFLSRLSGNRRGMRPSPGTRTLTTESGPAATYLLELEGAALAAVVQPLGLSLTQKIMKVGFSKAPNRRLSEINAYLPCEGSLIWGLKRFQWHDDEINAWAMEQRIFDILEERGIGCLKGEIYAVTDSDMHSAWQLALRTTQRPASAVLLPVPSE